eukprot:16226005-Heterocapsa_arctica.AAC.1
MDNYNILVRKGKEQSVEGYRLRKLVDNCIMEDITKQEEVVAKMTTDIKNNLSQRWRLWVDNSWARQTKDIYRWIRGNK